MKVSFIGLGKLGMPCAETIAKRGWNIVNGYEMCLNHAIRSLTQLAKNLHDKLKKHCL